MRVFIELPTWLGDSVMTTPAIENLVSVYPDAEIVVFGSAVSVELFKPHPNVKIFLVDRKGRDGFRALVLYNLAKSLGEFDLAISFRSHLYSKLLFWFLDSKKKAIFDKSKLKREPHQVQKYVRFVNRVLKLNLPAKALKLHFKPTEFTRETLGINAGATYGDAKRWYPERFANVAIALSDQFDIIIFGGAKERQVALEIEELIRAAGVRRVKNLAGETNIAQLCSNIGALTLFITNDSGPMHIAGAYKVPTVAIFGPTKYRETSQWSNPKSIIVRKELDCSPCMKRTCPIKSHDCMKSIGEQEVLEAVERLFSR